MKSKQITLIAVIAVVVISAVVLFTYVSGAYTQYASAFSKTTKAGSMEYDNTVTLTVDGQAFTSTGNMKIRDITTKVNFINTMNINGQTITQFTDGDFIYKDDGKEKTKIKIGDKPEAEPKGDFDMSYYEQEFSGLLDASRIKDLKIAEKINQSIVKSITKKSIATGSEYTVVLAEKPVNDIFESIINDQLSGDVKPDCTLKSFSYTATANKKNLIDSITYKLDMDVVFPAALVKEQSDVKKSVQIDFTMKIVNPGTAVQFTLPDTNGYEAK